MYRHVGRAMAKCLLRQSLAQGADSTSALDRRRGVRT